MSQRLANATGLYMEGIRDGNPRQAVEKYTGDRYRQHSTGVPDGKDGFLAFFDTDTNDKLIEHWDVIAPYSDSTPSGHTSIDGPAEVTDLERTGENKALVQAMIEDVMMAGGNPLNIEQYISADQYIQHNREVADGLEHFKPLAVAENKPLVYTEIVLMVGQGNFVATLCKANWEERPYAQADLFRIADGLIVEHWDAAEAIGPEEEWVNSGKF